MFYARANIFRQKWVLEVLLMQKVTLTHMKIQVKKMRMSKYLLILILIICCVLLSIIKPATAENGVTVVHGNQFILTLEDDGLVRVDHTILFTSNRTIKGVFIEHHSMDGTLIGEPTLVADSTIEHSEVLWKVEDEITRFTIIINATLEPNKMKAVRLSFTIKGLLELINDSQFFNRLFSLTSDAIAPPEVVVKVPKPSQFKELVFHEIIPTPEVFLEEGSFYLLTWKSSAFTFGNTTKTLVRLRYSSYTNYGKIITWIVPPFLGIIGGFLLTRLWDNRTRVSTWIKKKIERTKRS